MPDFHSFPLADLTPPQRYKLLSAMVVPRPIALVGTCNADGSQNAAPFSFFNVFSEDPAVVILGLQVAPDGMPKDTAVNIEREGEFVVNLVDAPLARQMNICAVALPRGESEIDAAGLTLVPSIIVAPGRIAEAPAALECRRIDTLRLSPRRDIVVGEVSHVHVRDGLIDPSTLNVDVAAYDPLGRLFAGFYARQGDRFDMPRMSLDQWKALQDG
ncbi:flavin reductase family protein [Pseudooceanicola sp. LIPI14-2-Ac024]|uniref:flavin reductase family protein n=1 Tax=Pseudooceanicola sp. LIPI14-2-Ac024 TaxID=3344875 RepID=UPI0035D05576